MPRGRRRSTRPRCPGAPASTRSWSSGWARRSARTMRAPRRPPGPRAGAGRGPRPALGPGRGDDRRGPATWSARSAAAYVRGLESAGVVATLKHFVGYSASRGRPQPRAGVDRAARARRRAAAAVRDGAARRGARSVMNSYTDIDGVPVAADADAAHRPAARRATASPAPSSPTTSRSPSCRRCTASPATRGEAAGAGAGGRASTSSCPRSNCYGAAAARRGRRRATSTRRWSTGRSSGCCGRSASWACSTPDWRPEPPRCDADRSTSTTPSRGRWPGELARRSVVLLRNDGTLPLAPGAPHRGRRARAPTTPQRDAGLLLVPAARRRAPPGRADGHRGRRRVLDALRADSAATSRSRAGCPVLGGDDEEHRRGGRGGRGRPTSASPCSATGPGCSAAAPPARAATRPTCGCPAGRRSCSRRCSPPAPRSCWCCCVGRPVRRCRARPTGSPPWCAAFFPGEEGARGARRRADRPGQPVRPAAGQLPAAPARASRRPTSAPPLGRRSEVSSVDPTPLFPFGHGLSYAPATWVDVGAPAGRAVADRRHVRDRGDAAQRRTASPTTEVVQVYLHDPVAEVARPVQQLIAAPRGSTSRRAATRTVVAHAARRPDLVHRPRRRPASSTRARSSCGSARRAPTSGPCCGSCSPARGAKSASTARSWLRCA